MKQRVIRELEALNEKPSYAPAYLPTHRLAPPAAGPFDVATVRARLEETEAR
jgi:hypothetical protein